MKLHSVLLYKIIILIFISQLIMSCFAYRPLVKDQSSKSMDEIVGKIAINKTRMIKLKTGITVKMEIERVDDKNIYGTLFQKDVNGNEHRYENDSISISTIEEPMNLEIAKIASNKLYMIKLKTGITVKMKIERVDDKNVYGTLFQKDIKGVEHSYENDSILISTIEDIKVKKLNAATALFLIIPLTAIAFSSMTGVPLLMLGSFL